MWILDGTTNAIKVISGAHEESVNYVRKKRSTPKSQHYHQKQPVTAIAYKDEYNIISAGTNDG